MATLEEAALQLFECPVCTHYMSPPIRQCVVGHVLCQDCYDRVSVCPQCRGAKETARVFTLERIFMLLTFPCRYAMDGCDFSAKGPEVKTHEKTCDFAPRLCPLREHNLCSWKGLKDLIVGHCGLCHPQFIHLREEQRLVSRGLKWESSSLNTLMVFHAYDTIFRFYWRLEYETNQLKFVVHYYGQPVRDGEFSYEVCILKGNTNVDATKLEGSCLCLVEEDEEYLGSNYVTVCFDLVKQCCSGDGNMFYTIKILKKKPDENGNPAGVS